MKNIEAYLIFIGLILFFIIIIFYKPIKDNHIYSKELQLHESDLIKGKYNTIDEDKFIKKAEESLYNIFGDQFNKSSYTASVKNVDTLYNFPYNYFVSVDFTENNLIVYSILFDLYSGNIFSIYRENLDRDLYLNSDILSEDTLHKLATDFLKKVNGQSIEYSNYTSYFLEDNSLFIIYFTTTKSKIYLELDSKSGNIVNYQKLSSRLVNK